MAKVHILPPDVISKIAAGEVIERPASVVKELIENSLDASPQSIELDIKHAGRTHIKIKDDGTGIEPDDIENIFSRHSTSKINTIEDIYRIQTLGFRGEALYSIASVSDIILRSKTALENLGYEIHLRANKKIKLSPLNMARGTEIEIKELFFNTPARRKFLKSDSTELNHIINTVIPYTILYPQKRFAFIHNEKKLFDLACDKDITERIAKALHLPKEHLISAHKEFKEEPFSIDLILGDMNIQRVNKELQFIFINQRPVYSRALSFHVNQIYRLILPPQVNPFFSLRISIPPEDVDVNVHPGKLQVKIKDEYRLISCLRPFLEDTLLSFGKAKQIKAHYPLPADKNAIPVYNASQTQLKPQISQYEFRSTANIFSDKAELPALNKQGPLKEKLAVSNYVGNFMNKYLLFEAGLSLLVIDQHAAGERINYERLKAQFETKTLEIQHLLAPLLIKVSPQEKIIWEEAKENIEKLGLATTLWDKETVAIHSHPQSLKTPEISLRNILSCEETIDCDFDILARKACRGSIMSGDPADKSTALYLRNQLLKCSAPFTCPHGRPTVIEIQEDFLNRQFLRSS